MSFGDSTLECHPKLDIRALQRGGLFDEYGQQSIVIHHYITFSVTYRSGLNWIVVEQIIDGKYYSQIIDLASTSVGFGKRAELVCPVLKKKCRVLHYYQGQFISRKAHPDLKSHAASPSSARRQRCADGRARLLGTDGRAPARGRNRARIIRELGRESWAETQWSDITAESVRLDDRARRVSQRKPRLIKIGPFSTVAGLRDGTSFTPHAVTIEHGIPEPLPNRMGVFEVRARVDEVPAIDLPTLMRAVRETGDGVRVFTLVWNHRGTSLQVQLTVDLRCEFWPRVHVQDLFGSGLPVEGVTADIVTTANNRDRFLCPVTKRPADTLFLREGVLGSRAALNLGYSSQLSAHRSARAKSGPKLSDQESYLSLLRKYGMRGPERPPTHPLTLLKDEFIKRYYELRYHLAMRGSLSAMMSIWKDYGIWDQPVEAAQILKDDARQKFLDELAAIKLNRQTQRLTKKAISLEMASS